MAGLRRITPRGAEDDLQLLSARIDYSMNEQDSARVYTSQPLETLAGESISLSESDDEIKVSQGGSDVFGGILRDIMRTGTRIELLVDSYARTARDEKPSGALNEVTQDDTTIVQNAIDDVPELTAGTLEGVRNNLEFTFHHASPALRIKLVEQATGHEARYNADKTVDFLAELGSDKTGTTLSPTNQQLVESIRVDHNAGDVVANHLRVIGADGSSVDVEAETFNTDAEREKWRRAYFRDTSADATLRARGETLLAQLGDPWTKVEATLTNPPGGSIDPQLGDTYNVNIPPKSVDDDLRITRLIHVIDADGEEWQATLSNRSEDLGHELERLSGAVRDAGSTTTGSTVVATLADSSFKSTRLGKSLNDETILHPQNTLGSGIVIVDVATPSSPSVEATFTDGSETTFKEAVAKDGTMYAAGSDTGDVYAVDISTKSSPSKLDTISIASSCENVAVHPSRNRVYAIGGDEFHVIDNSDTSALTEVTATQSLQGPGSFVDGDRDIFVAGEYTLVDVSTTDSPQYIATVPIADGYLSRTEVLLADSSTAVIGPNRLATIAVGATNQLVISDVAYQ